MQARPGSDGGVGDDRERLEVLRVVPDAVTQCTHKHPLEVEVDLDIQLSAEHPDDEPDGREDHQENQ